MKPYRAQQVGALLRRELANFLRFSAEDFPGYFFTVTEVRTSRDLKYADVWISILGDAEKRRSGIELLVQELPRIRHAIAGRTYLRRMPELRFKLDETIDIALRIEKVLEEKHIIDRNGKLMDSGACGEDDPSADEHIQEN